jgi:methylmalonyl-CoA/ethylmalonyl-CoA epimerase
MTTTMPMFPTVPASVAESAPERPLPASSMSNDELRQFNANRRIQQIAVVTRDLYRTMKEWVDTLGVGPWIVFTFTEDTVKGFEVNEKAVEGGFKFLVAIAHCGDIDFEIIQPVYGMNSYERFLRERGEGIHHVKEQIAADRIDDVIADYAAKGVGVLQHGNFDIDYHYNMDTEKSVRFIFELGNCPKLDISQIPHEIYPPEPGGPSAVQG